MSTKTQKKRTKKLYTTLRNNISIQHPNFYLNRKKMCSEVFVFEAGNLFIKSEFTGDNNIKLSILSGKIF